MTLRASPESQLPAVQQSVAAWFAAHARDLPWRRPGTSAWGILVSEVMSQQTPMSRVAPRWVEWLEKWPTPADLAAASPAEVLLAWDSLGYPRRAIRLRETAGSIAADYGNVVPNGETVLRSLPGIGVYTAAAVTAFAHGIRTTVLDVNIRRVLHRVFDGRPHPSAALSKRELTWAADFVPETAHVEWNAGVMELGALVCTSRNPACEQCPVAAHCRWLAAGKPVDPQRRPTTQSWKGTDRQLRGAIMAVLRTSGTAGVPIRLLTADTAALDAEALAEQPEQAGKAILRVRELGGFERVTRLIAALVDDGLAEQTAERLRLPG